MVVGGGHAVPAVVGALGHGFEPRGTGHHVVAEAFGRAVVAALANVLREADVLGRASLGGDSSAVFHGYLLS